MSTPDASPTQAQIASILSERNLAKNKIIAFLCELRESVSVRLLADLSEESVEVVEGLLRELKPLLVEVKGDGGITYAIQDAFRPTLLQQMSVMNDESISQDINGMISGGLTQGFLGDD